MEKKRIEPGWIVTMAGLGVNLMLGVLYAWGVISAALIDQLGWTATMTQIPYMVACAVFALSMVPGGRLQDRLGPRPVIMAAAALAGIGFLMSGLFLTTIGLTVFFGIVFGMGMGMGYAAPTPAAVKWFSPQKRGLISGIVVSGFGLAPLYIAPLTNYLLIQYGLQKTFFILGGGFFVFIMALAQLIKNPPAGFVAQGVKVLSEEEKHIQSQTAPVKIDYEWHEVLKTKQFYQLWIMFCFGTFAGLLIIGQLSKIGIEQAGMMNAYMLVGVYAIFNCAGRIGCGILSDRFGRMRTLFAMFILQVSIYVFFASFNTPVLLIMGVSVVGFTFGGMLTLFPASTVDYFGIKNFGINYGMVITAWGIGGVFGPLLGGIVRDLTGTYALSYVASGVLSAAGAVLTLFTKAPATVNAVERVSTGKTATETD
ncbi:MAG: OFA family MFS transporter [Bacillota bacterium]|nr:OFA family MFS transporter [Bacillota bacterium]MDW7676461.1 OFA family MFS transporter [Bacillota bacterium]